MPLVKTSKDQVVNYPIIVDVWTFEDVLRWSTVDGRESPVNRACSMRPPISGTHRRSRAKAGPSRWDGVREMSR